MTIGAFADQHRLKLQCDPDDGTDIIRGREATPTSLSTATIYWPSW